MTETNQGGAPTASLVVDQKQWAPTQILGNYACDGSVSGQGAGRLIQAQFAAWAGQPQPGATVQG